VIDDSDGFASPARRRVSAYVAAPIVLACGLIGYGLSLVFPLSPVPAAATAIAPVPSNVEPAPAAASDGSSTAPRQTAAPQPPPPAANEAPATPGKPDTGGRQGATTAAPIIVPASAPVPARAVETGSVAETPQAPAAPAVKMAAHPADTPEAATAEPEAAGPRKSARAAREMRRKRIRRLTRRYYRPQTKQAAGPFEALFPALVK
jgi:hypothetical protein